jgi:hypothetical protein
MVKALRRDQVAYRFVPAWIEAHEIEAEARRLREKRENESQQEADRRRSREAEQRIEEEKRKETEASKQARELALQKQYGAMARAFEGLLAAEMKDFVTGGSERFRQKYPDIHDWFRKELANKWELMSVDTTLVDYGISEFKGRSLESAFAQTIIKMRNRILGEYKETCFVTGFIKDDEFGMEREAFTAPCGDNGRTMRTHKIGQRFTSRWIVE